MMIKSLYDALLESNAAATEKNWKSIRRLLLQATTTDAAAMNLAKAYLETRVFTANVANPESRKSMRPLLTYLLTDFLPALPPLVTLRVSISKLLDAEAPNTWGGGAL